ncbi:nicotinate phosphoribosyltransferase [Geomonas sp. Red69]|uniref:nicotinate phosphoribosyltransferase n=1 Tax=Geomonas diazotrophica TaxID=2843197 RepID=UPI001C100CFD|nr:MULTISPECIES: nicotinate phosphoribosyltransferase [Geomonas]MBU5636292.1 nicotinate phosphoribosyltransferase [Geomonas diazotrophica]QXE88376.1 nicotinate phosphoribosyltransferase [Geomonas nitrogeniifigens]
MRYSPLLTDLYELTMLAGYLDQGMHERPAAFDLFFRHNPFHGGYAVFAGLDTALSYLEELSFNDEELGYLESLNIFKPAFLSYLSNFSFRGSITAPPEGTVVFGREPLLTVEGGLAEAQFVETALLNIINFQTLAATKAARIKLAAGDATVLEFGLRRAQGPDGGLSGARAAYIGGVRSTSNVLAGMRYGIPVRGTHAHSWIMAFPDELSAFRCYAKEFPDSCILLIDTYDTLKCGLPNALIVARELKEQGHDLVGVRIDSGDLAYLSRQVRAAFDEAGFTKVKIVASNELDENVIDSMRREGSRIDIYGVGTRLATCAGEGGGALGGVYKLVLMDGEPKLKLTSDLAKATLPGRKKVLRAVAPDGSFILDLIALQDEEILPGTVVFDPANPVQHVRIPEKARLVDLRRKVMEKGKRCVPTPDLESCADLAAEQLKLLPEGSLRLVNPHTYKVSISSGVNTLRLKLMNRIQNKYRS